MNQTYEVQGTHNNITGVCTSVDFHGRPTEINSYGIIYVRNSDGVFVRK